MAGNGENALEKHQMKFKRFRYCALNLGIFHFYHGHYKVSLAALEEAVKMAQETNDNHCLLHALVSRRFRLFFCATLVLRS